MATKKAKVNPEANPHLFLNLFRNQIRDCKPEIAVRVLNSIIGLIPDAELKSVARKATKQLLGKKVKAKKRDKFRRECLKKLRAMRIMARENDTLVTEVLSD